MDRGLWLQSRKAGIGGSDAPAIMGLSAYKTPLQVFMEKRGEVDNSFYDNDVLEWGRRLEPVIRQKYCDITGLEVAVPQEIIRHPDHDFIIGTPDGLAVDRVVEIKTANSMDGWGEEGTDQIPLNYLVQVQHYMMITGLPVADIAVLFPFANFKIYSAVADLELHALMVAKEFDFWHNNVLQGVAPDPVSSEDARIMFPKSTAGIITGGPEMVELHARLKALKEQEKDIEAQIEQAKTEVMAFIGEKDTVADRDGRQLFTWKSTKPGEKFEKDKFKAEMPEVYRKYITTSAPQRRFLIK